MEIQLKELIDQIKKDGVEAAETEADAILKNANEQAEKIIAEAKAEAEKILLNAKTENERMAKSSEDAIRQAGRNLLISFRESVARELNVILSENVDAVFSKENFAELIVKVIEGWSGNPEADGLQVILNSDDLNLLENAVLSKIKEKMLGGITLKANDNFDGGFRIAMGDNGAYYDYSTEAVVDMLSNYLSPKVTELLKEAK